MERSKVYQMIDGEREYQDAKWGTVEQNPHTVTDWLFIINHYWCKATDAHMGKQERLREIRKIAALAIAALEQYGCEPREGYAPQPDSAQEMGAGDWVRLEDLPPGMIFATQDGILAVKSEYYGSTRQCMCILLESGEYAHFEDGNDTLVTALELQRPTTAPDGEK